MEMFQMSGGVDERRSNPETGRTESGIPAGSSLDDRLEQVMETIRQGAYAAELVDRAIAENPDLARRIADEVGFEKQLRAGAPPLAPERIGHYRIRGELAHGGMGRIYKGWDSELYRDVAIKTIRQDGPSADYNRRFL